MTRSTIEQALSDLNNLVKEGKIMDAFEKHYHEDVIMQENNLNPTVSKNSNRERELEFLQNVTEFRKADVKGVGVGDGVSFVMWHFDYTHKEWGEMDIMQVAVQHWEGDKIIHEQFIYSN
jgi:hypothetical protein